MILSRVSLSKILKKRCGSYRLKRKRKMKLADDKLCFNIDRESRDICGGVVVLLVAMLKSFF